MPVDQRRQLVRAARRLLELQYGLDPRPVTVLAFRGPHIVLNGEPPPFHPTPIQQQILSAVGTVDVTSKHIARRIGHRHDSYFRSALGELVALGLIARPGSNRYRKPS